LEKTEGEFAAQMNTLPKFVASSSLSEHLPWNGTLLEADVSAEVAKLNEQTGKPSRMRAAKGALRFRHPSQVALASGQLFEQREG
jgi:hypothetical protein